MQSEIVERAGNLNRILVKGEHIGSVAKMHWAGCGRALPVFGFAIVLVVAARAFKDAAASFGYVLASLLVLGSSLVLTGSCVQLLLRLLLVRATMTAVTDRRVIYKTGLLKHRVAQIGLNRIKGVEVNRSLVGKALGYGTIAIRSTGTAIEEFRCVANPLALKAAIIEASCTLTDRTRSNRDAG